MMMIITLYEARSSEKEETTRMADVIAEPCIGGKDCSRTFFKGREAA